MSDKRLTKQRLMDEVEAAYHARQERADWLRLHNDIHFQPNAWTLDEMILESVRMAKHPSISAVKDPDGGYMWLALLRDLDDPDTKWYAVHKSSPIEAMLDVINQVREEEYSPFT